MSNLTERSGEVPQAPLQSSGDYTAGWFAGRDATLEGAIAVVENMKPAGGRAWSEGQAACFLCLDDLARYFKEQRSRGGEHGH
jgi:hypothetical protein